MNQGLSHYNAIDSVIYLNDLHQVPCDLKISITESKYGYEYYLNKGFRPQVLITNNNVSNWSYFKLDMKNLCMVLIK